MGLYLPDNEWLPGFDDFYTNVIEAKIRLPKHSNATSARTVYMGGAAAAAAAITLVAWLAGASNQIVGLLGVICAALLVGAIQLRMAGSSMGARETRNFVVESVAGFLGLEYRPELPLDQTRIMLGPNSAISPTAIARCVDHTSGHHGPIRFQTAQLMGGTGPARVLEDGRPGEWLGLPTDGIWEQYSVDGLFIACELPDQALLPAILSSDTRLTTPPAETGTLVFEPVQTGDADFDELFQVHLRWPPGGLPWLSPELRALLLECHKTLGPCSLNIGTKRSEFAAWMIGDAYEITSLGMALGRQAHRIAETMRIAGVLAQCLEPHGR